jgi:hypothetical protein
MAFEGMSAVLMAMSENPSEGVEGKIKGGFWRGLFLVFCS